VSLEIRLTYTPTADSRTLIGRMRYLCVGSAELRDQFVVPCAVGVRSTESVRFVSRFEKEFRYQDCRNDEK
jgi:hypothetical protein